jgi:hypothetical protein
MKIVFSMSNGASIDLEASPEECQMFLDQLRLGKSFFRINQPNGEISVISIPQIVYARAIPLDGEQPLA